MTARRRKPAGALSSLRGLLSRARGDEGMALPTVVALMVVSALLVAGVLTSSLSAVGSATSSRALVQAQASAEAGLAAAQSAIMSAAAPSALQCSYASSAAPKYAVQVQYGSGITGAPSCPVPVGALAAVTGGTALIVSTGEAAVGGTQGVTAGNTRRLQAVLTAPGTSGATPPPSSPPSSPSGSSDGGTADLAIFGFNGVTAQNPWSIAASTSGAADANVYSTSGGFSCTASASVFQGRVMSSGDVNLTNGCTVAAIWAGGRAGLDSSTVLGDVFAASTSTDTSAPAFFLKNSSGQVKGNVYANGTVSIADANSDKGVGGSVLSTAGAISLSNGPPIRGSAYGALGIALAQGSVGFDVVSTRGSLSDPQNPGARVGGNATVAGCISNKVTIAGTASPARKPSGQACSATAATTSSPALPEYPHNPPGVATTKLPATVAAPPRLAFPTLPSRATSAGSDPLDAWRAKAWDVQTFSGSDACTKSFNYLKQAVQPSTAEGRAWAAKPLLMVVRDCGSPLQLDADNKSLMRGSDTLTLLNDLAIMHDAGISNQNGSGIKSSMAGQDRSLYWIVPSDSPVVSSSSFPSCSGGGSLVPSNLRDLQDVRWFMYTPCAVSANNPIGTSNTPVRGSIYAGSVNPQSLNLRFTPMTVPGFSGGGVTSAAAAPSSSPTSSTGSSNATWTLTDVRDLSKS